MKKLIPLLAIISLFGLLAGGCSSPNNTNQGDQNLEDFGSYSATDEQPYFGDADVAELATSLETAYNDPAALSATLDSINDSTGPALPQLYRFRMVWGNLAHDSGITDLTDWSGKLTLSYGGVIVTHLIRFEDGQDYILPRYDSTGDFILNELGWVSQTSIGIDGIETRLIVPPTDSATEFTVTYESDQLTISFTQDELEALDTLIEIGAGNAISFGAMPFEPQNAYRGGLAGHWGRDDDGNGIFMARWTNTRGTVTGTLMGDWGVDDNGRRVFVGKWIDNSGRFEGFVKGTWHINGSGRPMTGQFRGQIYDADRTPIGFLKGHFKAGEHRNGGYLFGRWCVGCKPMSEMD